MCFTFFMTNSKGHIFNFIFFFFKYVICHNPASDNPGSDNPASDNPASDNPASDNPGSDNPASDNPSSDNTSVIELLHLLPHDISSGINTFSKRSFYK